MRSYSFGMNGLWGTACVSLEEGPARVFALRWLCLDVIDPVVHAVLDRIRFPKGSRRADEWGDIGQLWAAKVCTVIETSFSRRLFSAMVDTDLAELWERMSVHPAQRARIESELTSALRHSPSVHARTRGEKVSALPEIGLSVSKDRITLPGGRSYVPCPACEGRSWKVEPQRCSACLDRAGLSDKEYETLPVCAACDGRLMVGGQECTACPLVEIELRDGTALFLPPREAAAVEARAIARYDDGTLRRDAFAAGWVVGT